MNRKVFLAIALIFMSCMLVPVAEATPVSDDVQYSIIVNQNGDYAALSVYPQLQGATVYWDFDDGSFKSGQTVSHTWNSGFYAVKAVIVKSGIASVAEHYIGVYSESPVTDIQRNAEYRYAVYNGADAMLTVKDVNNKSVSWLTYDSEHRIVTGVPRNTGVYYATLTGDDTIEWSIFVTDGPVQDDWVRFSAHAEEGRVILDTLYNSSASSSLRYTWTLSDIDGTLISTSEGNTPNLLANPGVYGLQLKVQGKNTVASYTQFITLDGEAIPPAEVGGYGDSLLIIFVLMLTLTLLMFISTRDPRALFGAILSVIALGILVIL